MKLFNIFKRRKRTPEELLIKIGSYGNKSIVDIFEEGASKGEALFSFRYINSDNKYGLIDDRHDFLFKNGRLILSRQLISQEGNFEIKMSPKPMYALVKKEGKETYSIKNFGISFGKNDEGILTVYDNKDTRRYSLNFSLYQVLEPDECREMEECLEAIRDISEKLHMESTPLTDEVFKSTQDTHKEEVAKTYTQTKTKEEPKTKQ